MRSLDALNASSFDFCARSSAALSSDCAVSSSVRSCTASLESNAGVGPEMDERRGALRRTGEVAAASLEAPEDADDADFSCPFSR